MNINFYIPEPLFWIGVGIAAIFALKLLANWILPGND